ncbi:MAG: 4-hydroxy-tetrahydrodipicolinate synthase [Candidatus Subteraquimicrobiales bacterium]|nr:4-hydroxy-tetrahydrodipicolinate synthase [Candidatus Subteraquimicrobiales bacterium]
MTDFGEVLTAMVTPFKNDSSVDYDKAQELADYLINNGSDGLVISGTTGESPTLTSEEKLNLFKVVKEAVGNKASVIGGTGNYSTKESVELTRKAEKTGIDGCMLVGPYYNKPPQEGLFKHFKTIAESTSLPVIVYNVPSRTACNIEAETTIKLSVIENIVAVKEASGNLEQIGKISKETADDFLIYSGDDSMTLPILALGGTGAISVASHVVGKEIKEMITEYKKGNLTKAKDIHLKLMPLFKALFMTTNPIMVKAAVRLKGIDVGALRLPLIEATDDQIAKLKKVMEDTNVL